MEFNIGAVPDVSGAHPGQHRSKRSCGFSTICDLHALMPERNKVKHTCLLFVLFSCLWPSGNAGAQAPYPENLGTLQNIAEERRTLDSLFREARIWQSRGAGNQLLPVSEEALRLAAAVRDDSLLALAHYYLAGALFTTGQPDMALYNYGRALRFASDPRDIRLIAAILSGVGRVYESRDNYHEALRYFLRSLRLRENSGDALGVAESFNNIGIIHYNTSNWERALQYYQNALQIRRDKNDAAGISETLHNIGLMYEAEDKTKEAVQLYHQALQINEKHGFLWRAALNYNNLGSCARTLGRTSEALAYHLKTAKLQEEIADVRGLALAQYNVANDYFDLGRADSALAYARMSLERSEKTGNLYVKRNVFLLMGRIAERKSNYPAALTYTRQAQALNDSIYHTESQRLIADMNAKHDVDKKENEIIQLQQQRALEDLNARNEIYRLRSWLGVALAAIVLLGCVWVIARMRQARKEMQRRDVENLEKIRQQEAWSQDMIEVQENERKRIARELHDGICQAITVSRLNLINIPKKSTLDPDALNAIEHTADALDQTYRELRSLSHQMIPKALEVTGLCDAMEDLMGKTFAHTDTRFSFERGQAPRLAPQQEASLYRIFQELIANIVKHAQATEVNVQVYTAGKMLIMMVEDNGVGMHRTEGLPHEGIGLSNIRYRVQLLHGIYNVESPESGGTLTMIQVPCTQDIHCFGE